MFQSGPSIQFAPEGFKSNISKRSENSSAENYRCRIKNRHQKNCDCKYARSPDI